MFRTAVVDVIPHLMPNALSAIHIITFFATDSHTSGVYALLLKGFGHVLTASMVTATATLVIIRGIHTLESTHRPATDIACPIDTVRIRLRALDIVFATGIIGIQFTRFSVT